MESFLEMSQAGPSSPMGTGDYGSKNQPLDGDSNHISPGALQIKTQTHVISHNLQGYSGSFVNVGRNWCLRKDIRKRDRKENSPSRGRDLPKPQ